jgi:hypothetical protein
MAYQDLFGFLPVHETLSLSFGSVTPLPDYQAAAAWVTANAHRDGHLYPPQVHQVRKTGDDAITEKIPLSERCALLHRLPASHRLELPSHPDDAESARYGLAGFVMHMAGFLYGHRCHFHDWWLDGRVSIKSRCDYSEPNLREAIYCMEQAAKTWTGWPNRQRTVGLNLLFLKMRTHIYELEWERLQAEYQVFDGIYAVARDTGLLGKVSHRERIRAVCSLFGVPVDTGRVDTIVTLRNDLLHEALWDGGMPGAARRSAPFYASIWLDHLSRRLILALLGIQAKYIQSVWWALGVRTLDIVS